MTVEGTATKLFTLVDELGAHEAGKLAFSKVSGDHEGVVFVDLLFVGSLAKYGPAKILRRRAQRKDRSIADGRV